MVKCIRRTFQITAASSPLQLSLIVDGPRQVRRLGAAAEYLRWSKTGLEMDNLVALLGRRLGSKSQF